ncbi:MAG: hypothetical protein JNL08_08985 [Planctomycetes bacterium]|nr:hypothetical protein [Planctomycetota bacterium]
MIRALATPALAALFAHGAVCQEPTTPPPAAPAPTAPAAQAADGTWSEGFGRATNYRSALANAIEDAVAKVKGIGVARGGGVRSRLSVVSQSKEGDQDGWFDGEADSEREWVQQQIAGFVLAYEVLDKQKAEDRQWEVKVKAKVASPEGLDATVVVDLQDGDLREWQLERIDEQDNAVVGRERGEFAGPKIAEYLRNSKLVKIAAKSGGVQTNAQSAVREREKAGQQLVPSHRVVITWQPVQLRSLIEKPNVARPTAGARPEFLIGASVQVSVRVEDLIENVELLDRTWVVTGDAKGMPTERKADYVNAVVDKAKAEVAGAVFFKLKPPVVTRVWQEAEGGEWRIEAAIARRVAGPYRSFALGNPGSLSSPDWVTLGRAALLDGNDTTCTFRLDGVEDPSRIEPAVTEVRPLED